MGQAPLLDSRHLDLAGAKSCVDVAVSKIQSKVDLICLPDPRRQPSLKCVNLAVSQVHLSGMFVRPK